MRKLFYIIACFTAMNYFTNGVFGHLVSNNFDYSVLHDTGKKILAGQSNSIYDEYFNWTPGKGLAYCYPPQVAVLLSPLSLFNFETAKMLLKLITQVFVFWSFFLLLRTMGQLSVMEKLVSVFVFFNFYPSFYALALGQFEFFMIVPLLLAFYHFQKRNDWLSAFLLTIPVWFKIFPGVFLIYFIWKKEYSYSLKIVTMLLLTGAFSLLFVDFGTQLKFVQATLSGSPVFDSYPDNQAIATFFSRIFTKTMYTNGWVDAPALKNLFTYAFSLAVVVLSGYATRKKLDRQDAGYLYEFGFVIIGMLLVARITNTHHLSLLVIPFTYLFIRFLREGSITTKQMIPLAVCYGLFATYVPLPFRNIDQGIYAFMAGGGLPLLLLSIPFYFLAAFWVLNLKLLLGDKK